MTNWVWRFFLDARGSGRLETEGFSLDDLDEKGDFDT